MGITIYRGKLDDSDGFGDGADLTKFRRRLRFEQTT